MQPVEASLSLTGKAYKWWMSLSTRPTTWTEFERIFSREFLPVNEVERSWVSWDKCSMEHKSLTQYISDYREIVLKLKGIDEFQTLRGFKRGLTNEYLEYIEPLQPRDLSEAIKYAQIYDDIKRRGARDGAGRAESRDQKGSSFKRKGFRGVKQGDGGDQGSPSGRGSKKPRPFKRKRDSELHKKDLYAKARKENRCFGCNEIGHTKAECPKNRTDASGSEPRRDGKSSRQSHTVQRLPLGFEEFREVTVCHCDKHHVCSVSPLMWQPTVGPHDMVRMYGTIGGRRVTVFVDDGASHNFLNYSLVKKLGLTETSSDHEYTVGLANGYDKTVWNTVVLGVSLSIQDYQAQLDFQVMHLAGSYVYLGRKWLYGMGPSLTRSYLHNTL